MTDTYEQTQARWCASANHPIANWHEHGGEASCQCGTRVIQITREDAARFNAVSDFMLRNAPPIDDAAIEAAISELSSNEDHKA